MNFDASNTLIYENIAKKQKLKNAVYFCYRISETVRAKASTFSTQVDGITSQCIRKKYHH